MDELTIADFVGKASVADLQRLLNCLDSGEAGSGPDVEVLAALRKDPEGLGDYFRLVAETKVAQGGK